MKIIVAVLLRVRVTGAPHFHSFSGVPRRGQPTAEFLYFNPPIGSASRDSRIGCSTIRMANGGGCQGPSSSCAARLFGRRGSRVCEERGRTEQARRSSAIAAVLDGALREDRRVGSSKGPQGSRQHLAPAATPRSLSSIRRKTSGGLCGRTGCRTVSSNPSTTSSITAATLGIRS
jgi:hypothetical protein